MTTVATSTLQLLAILMMASMMIPSIMIKQQRHCGGMFAGRILGVSGFQQHYQQQRQQVARLTISRLYAAKESALLFSSPGFRTISSDRNLGFSNRFYHTTNNPLLDSHGSSSRNGESSPSALHMGRRSRRRRNDSERKPKYPPRVLKVPDNGETPDVAMVYPERYQELLQAKVATLQAMVLNATSPTIANDKGSLPPIEVFESSKEGYRMRANFKMWRTGGPQKKDTEETNDQEDKEAETPLKVDYVMFERGDNRTPVRVTKYPMGSPLLQQLMDPVKLAIESNEELHHRINDIRFLTTLAGDALVTITYNRPIGDEWCAAAAKLAKELDETIMGPDNTITLVGRSRKIKLVVKSSEDTIENDEETSSPQQEEATVRETLKVPMVLNDDKSAKEFHYVQTEGAFSQPNAEVCQSMLAWAYDATANIPDATNGKDLCELYCGNGCFTVVLASNFRRVVATEMSKASVNLAQHNLSKNNIHNTKVGRLNAEDFVLAYEGQKFFRRLDEAGIRRLSKYNSVIDGEKDNVVDENVGSDTGVDENNKEITTTKDGSLDFDRLHTLFVDPPRAGLDETCRELAAKFETVVYVSCNPETLARDLSELVATHDIIRLAAFDQFPYTPHLEAGVVLQKKKEPMKTTDDTVQTIRSKPRMMQDEMGNFYMLKY